MLTAKLIQDYLNSVCNELLKREDRSACSIYFEHPLAGNDFPEKSMIQLLHMSFTCDTIFRDLFMQAFHMFFIQSVRHWQ